MPVSRLGPTICGKTAETQPENVPNNIFGGGGDPIMESHTTYVHLRGVIHCSDYNMRRT
jgi:hypothetical protein